MDRRRAIDLLERQIKRLHKLEPFALANHEYKKWSRDTQKVIDKIFESAPKNSDEFTNLSYKCEIIAATSKSNPVIGFSQCLQNLETTLESMVDEIEDLWDLPQSPQSEEPDRIIRNLCSRFHIVCRRLLERHDNRDAFLVNDEYDVQDLFHALLLIYFDDVRSEEWTPSYAGSSSRMDFLLKSEQIIIEIKKTRSGLIDKQLGEQLVIDIKYYQSHPDCQILYAFVNDPDGLLGNPRGIENDLNKVHDNLPVNVIIGPR